MSKTNWILVLTIVLTAVNAVVPFMPSSAQAVVIIVLSAVASIFHISDVKTASAAPKPQQ